MDEKLEKLLVKKYPVLYKNYGGPPTKTCMAWGFGCGNGWFKIIDELSNKLEPYGVIAAQVKEKFGGLRFYIEPINSDDYKIIHKLINETESLSYKICERCGNPGTQTTDGWIKTLCDECKDIK